ncbi:putative signal transduction protein with CBS domains [Chloroherpeton thalassium ATCC 35110]|uniref:Putative signal transduction protein with CBS domains n=1 Tax=Chloroherpeton thalassium (strain ATCC 35110 / GB-78) TaxID=517418 RepID=B3QY87_CHLT3|nr:CBS domain-containing protein [Chloroherpeton thalassium]ACF15053.1 putative signal transduction protein with CBS domains [Chloroherpeton thalassium ATCC 35110]
MNQSVIHKNIPVLKPSDTLKQAIALMREMRLEGLPVVNDGKFIGVLLETDVDFNIQEGKSGLEQHVESFVFEKPVVIRVNQHPYEVMKHFDKGPYCFLPVVDNDEKFLGIIFKEDIVDELNEVFRVLEDGTVMEFEVPSEHFRMSEMIRIIEQNDARVLSIASRPSLDSPTGQIITAKLEAQEPFRLQQTLEKIGYPVIYSSANTFEFLDDMTYKAQALLRYLEI